MGLGRTDGSERSLFLYMAAEAHAMIFSFMRYCTVSILTILAP